MSVMLAAQPYTHFSSAADRTATEPPELRGLRRDGVRLMIASPAEHPSHSLLPPR